MTYLFFCWQVDNLKDKVLKKLEQVLGDMNLESGEVAQLLDNFDESSKKEIVPELSPENSQTVSEIGISNSLSIISGSFKDSW